MRLVLQTNSNDWYNLPSDKKLHVYTMLTIEQQVNLQAPINQSFATVTNKLSQSHPLNVAVNAINFLKTTLN